MCLFSNKVIRKTKENDPLLTTALVGVKNNSAFNYCEARALLDSGSQFKFVNR